MIIEDVERIEKFLAHQIPDIVAAACTPAIMFCYLLTLNVPMALGMLVPVVLGVAVQLFAMAATGKQMPTYHRLLAKLNAAIMQFINGMPVMKAYRLDAKGYREYADAVTEYNEFWKQCTKSQGYSTACSWPSWKAASCSCCLWAACCTCRAPFRPPTTCSS